MDQHIKPENEQPNYTKTQQMILSALKLAAWIASFIAFMHITQA